MDSRSAAHYVNWSCVDKASAELAVYTKGTLSDDELRVCFTLMCGPKADEALWERFQSVYRNHRKKTSPRRVTLVQTYTGEGRLKLADSTLRIN